METTESQEDRSLPFRLLSLGSISPLSLLTVRVNPPLTLSDQQGSDPVAVSNVVGAISIVSVSPDKVVLRSHVEASTPYALVLVPKPVLRILMTPWKQMAKDLQGLVRGFLGKR